MDSDEVCTTHYEKAHLLCGHQCGWLLFWKNVYRLSGILRSSCWVINYLVLSIK